MYKQCKTEQSAARQRQLETGLLDLMEKMPYEQITISDLCVHLQIPRKTFYRYFPTKEDALHCLVDHTFLDMANYSSEAGAVNENRFQWEMRRMFCFWKQQERFLDAIVQNNLSHLLFQRITPLAMSEMTLFRGSLPAVAAQDREYVVDFLAGGLITMILRWQRKGFAESVDQMAATAAALLMPSSWG